MSILRNGDKLRSMWHANDVFFGACVVALGPWQVVTGSGGANL